MTYRDALCFWNGANNSPLGSLINNRVEELTRERIRYILSNGSTITTLIKEGDEKMPKINNYTYDKSSARTTIEWSDGSRTTVRAEKPETADEYTGFMMAIAKKAMGNKNQANNLADYWLVKKPQRDAAAKAKADAELAEKNRIEAKHRAKKEKYLIRKKALRRKRDYEARKLAFEKYGVPMEDGKEV